MGLSEVVEENFQTILLGGGGIVAYYQFTDATPPGLPDLPVWWELAAAGAVLAVVGALFASGKIDSLLPDPPKVHIYVVDAKDTEQIPHYELTPDAFSKVEVAEGTLMELPGCQERSYEAKAFDPETLVAVGTWRESASGSELVGHHAVTDALSAIGELEDHLEPMAQEGKHIKQFLPSIVRNLDVKRMDQLNAAISGRVAPAHGEGDGIEDVITEHLPDHLRPERYKQEDAETLEAGDEDVYGFELLEEEAIEPRDPMLNDGGSL